MRHLIGIAFLVVAGAAYVFGVGPLFFGAPLVGAVLLLIGAGFEIGFWRRLKRGAAVRSSSAPGRQTRA
jgi:hypothetical protein